MVRTGRPLIRSLRAASVALLIVAGLIGAQSASAVTPASASGAATTGVLYSPNTSANPSEDASYPRVIRLANNGSANGTVLNPQSGRCLDDPQANTANGTRLQIYDCNGVSTQQWTTAA